MSVAPAAQAGTGWEFIPGFISSSDALLAAEQAIDLATLPPEELERFAWRPNQGPGLAVVKVDINELDRAKHSQRFRDLLRVYFETDELARNNLDRFSLTNRAPHAETAGHEYGYYPEAKQVIEVGLSGVAELVIEDPGDGQIHTITMLPTDAIRFRNHPDVAQRPFHVVRNVLADDARISLMNG